MKKYILLLIIIFLTGCTSYVELNNLAIINIIGIEKTNDDYNITISLIDKIDALKPTMKTISIKDSNLNKAFIKLNSLLDKKIYLSHLNVLVINDSIKDKELNEVINFFLNNRESREDFLVTYSNNINDVLEKSKFQEINNLIQINYQETSEAIYTTMYDLIKNYYNNKKFYLTNIDYKDNIYIKGITSFKNNNYQELDNKEAIFINYLLNDIQTYNYTYKCNNNKYLNLKIINATSNTIKKDLIITNEINIISNDCNLKKENINDNLNKFLQESLSKYTNKKITIKNTIRGNYENK